MKSTWNPTISWIGIVVQIVSIAVLFFYDYLDGYWLAGHALLLILFALNLKHRLPSGGMFFVCVGCMLVAMYYWPSSQELVRKYELSDFIRSLNAGINFLMGSWLYIYNRVRW